MRGGTLVCADHSRSSGFAFRRFDHPGIHGLAEDLDRVNTSDSSAYAAPSLSAAQGRACGIRATWRPFVRSPLQRRDNERWDVHANERACQPERENASVIQRVRTIISPANEETDPPDPGWDRCLPSRGGRDRAAP